MKTALMKRQSSQGFTLIELMVAITIIAILAVVGVTLFTNVQKSARDAKRKADIDAIANALETNKTVNSTTYNPLTPQMFSAGAVPQDQMRTTTNCATNICIYCINTTTTIGGTPPTQALCPSSGYTEVAATVPDATTANWTVCANLEAGGFYCKSNGQ